MNIRSILVVAFGFALFACSKAPPASTEIVAVTEPAAPKPVETAAKPANETPPSDPPQTDTPKPPPVAKVAKKKMAKTSTPAKAVTPSSDPLSSSL
jgi:hypothetical protein